MSRDPTPPRPNFLTDPARAPWRAAQSIAASGKGWEQRPAAPEGEVVWREDGDAVVLTPDGWLVFVGHGTGCVYCKQVRATDELEAALRGGRVTGEASGAARA